MIEQEYSLCWSCLLTDHCAALAFFRSVPGQTNDSRWVTKKPTNDNPLHVVESTDEYTTPSNWRISNSKSTVWKLSLIVEGQLTTLSPLPLWHYLRLT